MSKTNDDILLESGTNELEVVMFKIGSGNYGINVLKVREIINAMELTPIPNAHPDVEGVIRLREEVLPVVNLEKVLGIEPSENPSNDKFIIGELNKLKVAFRVHHVSRIHRISWEQIEKPTELSAGDEAYAIGIIKLEEYMSILLDFEKIIVEIQPSTGVNVDKLGVLGHRERSQKRLVVAEDSPMLRRLLKETLEEAGYERLTFFENGKEAWDYLGEVIEDEPDSIKHHVDLLITDIEMPQMDGHHLTDLIKKDNRLKDLPVIVFSSLITDDLYHKGDKVGADAQVSKPEIVDLVQEIDALV
ncbi:MAG TPA: chemotaxis protein [Pseudogracilibacillus sp.]|nr:chemotaxis protein [Pseudogracilibacillus sp.]